MKMHFKPILWLVGGIVLMFAASLVLERYRNVKALNQLSNASLAALEEREWKSAENVFLAGQNAVKGSLERGEMEKFLQILKSQNAIKGLMEFSLFSREGETTHSSDSKFVNKKLPAELRDRLLTKMERVTRRTPEAFEIYQPQRVTADCVRCHTSWQAGESGGVLFCRFSTESLAQSQQQWSASMAAMKRDHLVYGSLTALVIAVVFGTLAVFVVRQQIAAPLVRVIQQLTTSSDQVRTTADQLSGAGQSLSAGASRQAAALEETSASLTELAAITKANANTAHNANSLTGEARQAAEAGASSMQEMQGAMNDIQTASASIAKIIKAVDEIAFQTNLLALNAAVEAARAGDAGLGFAVVAEEVRTLAQRSALAAKETAQEIESSIFKSKHGVEMSSQVARNFQQIMEKVRQVDELVAQIASASKEQSDGIGQLDSSMREMDTVTQSNAANAEQSASAAMELQARRLLCARPSAA